MAKKKFANLLAALVIAASAAGTTSAEQNARVVNARFRNLDVEQQGETEDFSVPIISVRTKGPKSVESDEPATYHVKVRNISSKKDAKVNVLITYSSDCSFVNANPQPQIVEAGRLEYVVDNIPRLSEQDFEVVLLPPQQGEIQMNVVCSLEADNSVETIVKRPALQFDVNTPAYGQVGDEIPVEITVINTGDGIVRDAHISADLPPEITVDHASVEELTKVFSIEGGKSHVITMQLRSFEPGMKQIGFQMMMGNVATQKIQTTLCVTKPTTDLHFVGPAQHIVGQESDYSLIVENNNQTDIENAQLDIQIPTSLQVTKVSRFADLIQENDGSYHLTWPLNKIAAGERVAIRLRATGLVQQNSDCKIQVHYSDGTKKISNYSISVVSEANRGQIESASNIDLTEVRTGDQSAVSRDSELNR
jgi:hypothetical protein